METLKQKSNLDIVKITKEEGGVSLDLKIGAWFFSVLFLPISIIKEILRVWNE